MVKYRRNKLDSPDAIYFLTISTAHHHAYFESKENAAICFYAMNYMVEKYNARYLAWVIMPDHIHWLIKPGNPDYSKIVFAFKRRISSRLISRISSEGTVKILQDRFWEHTVKDENELSFYVDSIHYNPVKHGYVSLPNEWDFSSFRDYVKRGYYGVDWTLRDGDKVNSGMYGEN